MKTKVLTVISMAMLLSGRVCTLGQDLPYFASGNGGVVAAGAQDATKAGISTLQHGGNAVDAAVAVIFNLAVSDYGLFCIGGEVPFMYYDRKTEEVIVFNGMGGAPSDKDAIEWYYRNGIPSTGIKAATVPSAVSTLLAALGQKGTMSFGQVIEPTLKLLDTGGKDWYRPLAATLRKMVQTEKETTGTREEKIKAARDRFYKGDIADELDKYYRASGGFLRKADLMAHTTIVEKPVSVTYRGLTVNKCNTWTQGPVLLQTLRLAENFNLGKMGFFSADYIHVLAESMKLAYADRDMYYGDPQFSVVPLEKLLSDEYTKLRFPLIDMDQASQTIRPGDPWHMLPLAANGQYRPGEAGTTTCTVTDKWGNMVAATPSANPEYGICMDLGIAHNTRLSSLNTEKGHPNCLEAGKRPRITLTPTLVLKEGKPFMAISVAGGDMQDQTTLQILLDIVEFGMLPKEAVTAPRFITKHMQDSFNPSPDPLKRTGPAAGLEINSSDKSLTGELTKRGHKVTESAAVLAWPVVILTDPETGMAYGAGQPAHNGGGKTCAALNNVK